MYVKGPNLEAIMKQTLETAGGERVSLEGAGNHIGCRGFERRVALALLLLSVITASKVCRTPLTFCDTANPLNVVSGMY